MRLVFTHSHVFPGAKAVVDDSDDDASGRAFIEFADGSTAIGEHRQDGDGLLVAIPSYRTAKGAQIRARRWRLTPDGAGAWRAKAAPLSSS